MADKKDWNCEGCCMCKKALGVIVLLIGLVWLAADTGLIALKLPWLPLLVVAAGAGIVCKSSLCAMCKK